MFHTSIIVTYIHKYVQHYVVVLLQMQILSEIEASNIMQQVVEGVQYLHSHNILHRDMSLSNLLLTKNMQVVSGMLSHCELK